MIGISITWTSSIVLGSEVEFESISCKHLSNIKNPYYVINYMFIQITLGITLYLQLSKKFSHIISPSNPLHNVEEFEQIQSYLNYCSFYI